MVAKLLHIFLLHIDCSYIVVRRMVTCCRRMQDHPSIHSSLAQLCLEFPSARNAGIFGIEILGGSIYKYCSEGMRDANCLALPSSLQRSLGGGGGGGGLQRRTEELTAQVKKLEEEKAGLKQDNASLVSYSVTGYTWNFIAV